MSPHKDLGEYEIWNHKLMLDCFFLQVKPLLKVTNAEEKLSHKEQELRQASDQLDRLKQEHETLSQVQKQLIQEKSLLTEQLQAELELSADAEEV